MFNRRLLPAALGLTLVLPALVGFTLISLVSSCSTDDADSARPRGNCQSGAPAAPAPSDSTTTADSSARAILGLLAPAAK